VKQHGVNFVASNNRMPWESTYYLPDLLLIRLLIGTYRSYFCSKKIYRKTLHEFSCSPTQGSCLH